VTDPPGRQAAIRAAPATANPSPSLPGRVLLVATRSGHKLAELRALLALPGTRLIDLDEAGIAEESPEEGSTFDTNAMFKARFYGELSGLPTLADDSGIEVDALGGGPGVRTRRYAGEGATDAENNAKLLRELAGLPAERRTARYRCTLALWEPEERGSAPGHGAGSGGIAPAGGGSSTTAAPATGGAGRPTVRHGSFEGRIAAGPRGTGGFGYDPIFEPLTEPVGGRTVGLYSQDEKNRVSHRARAARAMRRVLVSRGY